MLTAKSDVQVDTPEVRVTEWRLAPGSATGHHTHEMDYVIVPVTSGEMTIVAPNGERSKAQLGVGKSYFRKAGVRARRAQRNRKRDRVPGGRAEAVSSARARACSSRRPPLTRRPGTDRRDLDPTGPSRIVHRALHRNCQLPPIRRS